MADEATAPTPPPETPAAPAGGAGWRRHVPNALTNARVVMTVAFVAVLSVYDFPDRNEWALPVALALFVVAAITDALDGYFARRWNVISVYGRIVDPFADKLLILGAFVMLAGPGFSDPKFGVQVTGVASWMVVVVLSRELLVTTIRAVFEGRGADFSAAWSGKVKMIAQSLGIPLIMLITLMDASSLPFSPSAACLAIAWSITLLTAASAVPYIIRAAQ